MKIVQSAYIRDLLEEEDLSDCKSVNIPMKAGSDIAEPDDYEEADLKSYQRLIGKLMYLSCATRPDIAFVVSQLSTHNADPRAGYMRAAKSVVWYLKGSIHIGLVYDQKTINDLSKEELNSPPPFVLIAYDDQTPPMELNTSLWAMPQEKEYWMRRFLNEMALGETTEVVLNGDNESSLSSTKNPEAQNRTKHIDVQHHYLRELINPNEPIVA